MAETKSRHIRDLIASRRALLGGLAGLPLLNLAGCASAGGARAALPPAATLGFQSVPPTLADTITLPPGYRWRTLIAWGDPLHENMAPFDPNTLTRAEQEHRFGTHNDMLALFAADYAFPPPRNATRMILCANNEYFDPSFFFPSLTRPSDFTTTHLETALASTGITVVQIEQSAEGWRVVRDAPGGINRRITPFTPVVFSGPAANHPWIQAAGAFVNAREAGAGAANPPGAIRCGTNSNCAGGLTPWGTYLSAEENFNFLYALNDERAPAYVEARRDQAYILDTDVFGYPVPSPFGRLAPAQFDLSQNPHGPTLYGWTLEVDPHDPAWAPRKRTALGRRKGECATTALTRDGHVAVYSGDDQIDEFVYKFITRGRFNPADRLSNRDLLDEGQLYVARFEEDGSGRWLPVTLSGANAAARAAGYGALFRDEADLMVRAREAARLLGATPMDRPEDVEALLDANWVGLGPVLIACTNNNQQGFAHPGNPRRQSETPDRAQANAAGHILRIDEANADAGATRFTWDIFALGGDPDAEALTIATRSGRPVHVSPAWNGAATISGDRFACPDNMFVDSRYTVWVATDGSDNVFADCNDSVLATPAAADGARPVRRFLVGPMGAEICGPLMAPDERAFFCSIQHPGENDAEGASIADIRWTRRQPPPSTFPDGSWPRSAVIVVTREDGGRIGD